MQTDQTNSQLSRPMELLSQWHGANTDRANRIMGYVGFVQWLLGVILALWFTPWTWIGETRYVHLHVWIAFLVGGLLVLPPIWLSRQSQYRETATYVFTVAQVLFSCLLIHFTGGRIESHFHVFGSMALLSMYRNVGILFLAMLIVASDHFLRGVFWPQSVFGVVSESSLRWMEHAAWLAFENSFLILGIRRHNELVATLAQRQSSLEVLSKGFEHEVIQRTAELTKRSAWFEQSLAAANAFSWFRSDNGQALRISGNMEHVLGYSAEHGPATGDDFENFLHPDFRKPFRRALRGVEDQALSKLELEIQLKHANGQYRWFRLIGETDKNSCNSLSGICIDIHERREAKLKREKLQQEFSEISHRAGMAEIANGVLHNVGNVLNSVNASANHLARLSKESKLKALPEAAALLESNAGDLPGFFRTDPRGTAFSKYLTRLGQYWKLENADIRSEIRTLEKHVGHMCQVIKLQQQYAGNASTKEILNLDEVLEAAVETMRPRVRGREVQLVFERGGLNQTTACRHSILQIVYNLISNAVDSVTDPRNNNRTRLIRVRSRYNQGAAEISVRDTGLGFTVEEGTQLFRHGFTTKADGHGFGLHSCALLAKNLGGELKAESAGAGLGAKMTLVLPCGDGNCGWSPPDEEDEPVPSQGKAVFLSSGSEFYTATAAMPFDHQVETLT